MLGKEKIKAIIFDMDGVLFYSTACHEEAFRLVLTEDEGEDFIYSEVAGMRTDEALRFFYTKRQRPFDEAFIEKKMSEKRGYALRLLRDRGRVASGVFPLLQKLQLQYRLVLASSASPETVDLFLDMSQTKVFFDFILDGSMVKNAKPEPEIYQLAVQKLGVLPEECVVVEDALKGAEASQNAGIPMIIVSTADNKEEFLHFKPFMIVSEVQEVEKILL